MTVTIEGRRVSLMRERPEGGHHRVTYVELFFDLVFVFAVTQISHSLLRHFTPLGVVEVAVLFLAMWWAWVFTSWITNWLDPEQTPVRICLFLLMLAGLVLSTSIPKAFEDRGLAFGVAFAAFQVGRSLFTLWSIPSSNGPLRRNFLRITVWLLLSGVLWVAGGLADSHARLLFWIGALAIEYASPVARFWVPALGASSLQDWSVEGGHMAERCALFIIIALGESILVTGATFAELAWTPHVISAFLASFVGSLAMWWIYFHKGAEAGAHNISHAEDPGRLARLAYTYLHMPIVAGIIVVAVGDELVLAHPDGHSDLKAVIGIVGGPLLFLIGVIFFKRTIHGLLQLSHLVGIAALLLLVPFAHLLSPLMLSLTTTAVLAIVAIWEAISIGNKATLPSRSSVGR
jgi:low temperature requirement protein LtrA